MNKGLMIGALVVLGSGAYLGGVAYTGQQADSFVQQQLDVVKQQLGDQGDIAVTATEGFFESQYRIEYTLSDYPEPIFPALETNKIPMDLTVKHGFLSANSTVVLAEGELLDVLKRYLDDSDQAPFVLESTQSFNPISQTSRVNARAETARMSGNLEDGSTFVVGAAQVEFNQSGRDFTATLTMDDSYITAEDGELRIEGVSGEETGVLDSDFLQDAVMAEEFNAVVRAEQIVFRDAQQQATLDSLAITVDQILDGGRVLLSVGYGAEKATLEQGGVLSVVEVPNLSMTFDFDYQAVRDLAEVTQSMQPDADDPEAAFEQMQLIVETLDRVTQEGVGIDLNDLSFEMEGEKAQAKADLNLVPFTASDLMMSPLMLLQYMELQADVSVPVAMSDKLGDEERMQLQMLVEQGFFILNDTDYTANLSVEEGKILLNGSEFPLF
ncbi:DUF945 family protein [Neptunomonas phycophila]|uniref:DUF945 family protein n=1 Tax=Neptunomonas phycophila TaxID=1572645 RepID=UPI0037350015